MASEFIREINYIIMCIYCPFIYHSMREMHPRENAAILHRKIHESHYATIN